MKLFRVNGNVYISTDPNMTSLKTFKHIMESTGTSITTCLGVVELIDHNVNLSDVENSLLQLGYEKISLVDIIKKEV